MVWNLEHTTACMLDNLLPKPPQTKSTLSVTPQRTNYANKRQAMVFSDLYWFSNLVASLKSIVMLPGHWLPGR
jgi:hypothetical protein